MEGSLGRLSLFQTAGPGSGLSGRSNVGHTPSMPWFSRHPAKSGHSPIVNGVPRFARNALLKYAIDNQQLGRNAPKALSRAWSCLISTARTSAFFAAANAAAAPAA